MCKWPVPHTSSLLHTTTAWGTTRREMTTGKIKSKYGSLQLCWLQLARGANLWAPKRKGILPWRGCFFTPSPPHQLVGLSLAKHFYFGFMRGRKNDTCCFPWVSVQVRDARPPQSQCCGHPSSSPSNPWGLPAWASWLLENLPQQHSILCVLLCSFGSDLPKLLTALQGCQTGLLD